MPDSVAPPPTSSRRRLARALLAVLAISGVVALLWRERMSLGVLRNVSLSMSALIVLIMSVNTVLFGLRVRIALQRVAAIRIRVLWWTRVFINSFAMNLSVPQSGAVYRAMELRRVYGMRLQDYLRAYYVVVWLGYVLIVACSTPAMFLSPVAPLVGGWDLRLVAVLTLVGLALGPVLLHRSAPHIGGDARWAERFRQVLDETVGTALECVRERRFATDFLFFSILTIAIDFGIVVLALAALGFNIALGWSLLLYLAMQLFNMIHVTPGNIGVQELVFGVLGGQAGLSLGDGVVLSLFLRVLRAASLVTLFATVNVAMAMGARPRPAPHQRG